MPDLMSDLVPFQSFLFTCPGTSLNKVNTILYFIFNNYMYAVGVTLWILISWLLEAS